MTGVETESEQDLSGATLERPIAVVGTDTDVGKTVVTAGITRGLRRAGADARAIKPAQTGHPPDDDASFVADACGDADAATCPRYLEPALAPRVAAEEAGAQLAYDDVLTACEEAIAETPVPIVEGIGGLRVPLAGDREVIDLVADLEATAVVVTRSGLGTLNHSALSVDALEHRGVDVAGVVCNEYAGATVAERTNPDELERMTGHVVETIPPLSGESPAAMAAGVVDALPTRFFETLVDDDR
ncbi:dethiobiotin synthase [Natronolimnohabitans innermongolicus]|uniref:ATP-dependent dethiobiotin synthetase BioD n=1 Tax=Natronolimnohabitans innermongolicus JCM 12255 TaxID=1227499 RepID=L9X743_9EURY|nr:dethiobiotin synthase [Natronolimnohabitans innermongolicus]ELY57422.1 dethiobiotin synthase [Natronolimnohabitans innermongolicus JCM 12255]